jgi:hypothetical protein
MNPNRSLKGKQNPNSEIFYSFVIFVAQLKKRERRAGAA